jgi:hypothetical protein
MPEPPFVSLGELSKPATVLVEKISDAVGGVFKPYQIIRVAKAEAEADKIRAEAQILISDLQRRAMHRFLEEEGKKQANIESITAQALPLLDENANPKNVSNDWIANFFDRARIVSDVEMQQLWARVLAGEANDPGTFSRKTINLLADLGKVEAEWFTMLCGYIWNIGGLSPLIYDIFHGIYLNNGINFNVLVELEALGLIKISHPTVFSRAELLKVKEVTYFGRSVTLDLKTSKHNVIPTGHVILTVPGKELAGYCGSQPVPGFYEYIVEQWRSEAFRQHINCVEE